MSDLELQCLIAKSIDDTMTDWFAKNWTIVDGNLSLAFAAAVLAEIQKTHILVPKDPSTCADFDDSTLESFTSAIECEVELSGGYLGSGHLHVFAVHALSWLEDHGFRVFLTDEPVEPIRQDAAKSDTLNGQPMRQNATGCDASEHPQ